MQTKRGVVHYGGQFGQGPPLSYHLNAVQGAATE